jgi:hypothetical protein
MSNKEITALIHELNQIHLHQQLLISAFEDACQRSNSTQDNVILPPSPANIYTFTVIPPFIPTYRSGDLVIVTNKVRRPRNRPVDIKDSKAIAFELASLSRVNIKT